MRKNNELIIILSILLQGLFIIIINNLLFSSNNISSLKSVLPGVNIIIVLLLALSIYSIKELQQTAECRIRANLLKNHLNQVEELLKKLQTQRHEYGCHLQTIQSMVYLGREKELKEYLNGITKGFQKNNEFIYAGHPAVSGLLNIKSEIAKSHNIKFAVAIKTDMAGIKIPPWDLCTVLGNLIENAMEASLAAQEPRVGIEIKLEANNYIIYVVNNGAKISEQEKEMVFEAGYSTKGYPEHGYGLYLAKKVVDQHGGNIFIETSKQTNFIVRLPGGVAQND